MTGIVLSDAGLKSLEEAFEQVKYFVEDLDHANGNAKPFTPHTYMYYAHVWLNLYVMTFADLIPLNGVEVIIDYLHCDNM